MITKAVLELAPPAQPPKPGDYVRFNERGQLAKARPGDPSVFTLPPSARLSEDGSQISWDAGELLAPVATKPKEDFELIELMQKDAPDVRFRGKLLGEIDSRQVDERQRARDSDRYTKLELYLLEGGNWVAAKVACSDRTGEVDIAAVKLLAKSRTEPRNMSDLEFLQDRHMPAFVSVEKSEEERRREALEAFGWTWLAKAFADKMGWDHVQELA
jgi:hypothetical protein